MKRLIAAMAIATTLPLVQAVPPTQAAPSPRCIGANVTLLGTDRSDVIQGTEGNDIILGKGGNDTISGNGGIDAICGGEGADMIYVSSRQGAQTCDGAERETLSGGRGNDKLYGGGAYTRFYADAGDDLVKGCLPNPNDHSLITYQNAPGSVDIRLWRNQAKGWGSDTLIEVNGVGGSEFRDIIVGSDFGASNPAAYESLSGAGGNDFIKGLAGSDSLFGGVGDDEIRADDQVDGNDYVSGDADTDSCIADLEDRVLACEPTP